MIEEMGVIFTFDVFRILYHRDNTLMRPDYVEVEIGAYKFRLARPPSLQSRKACSSLSFGGSLVTITKWFGAEDTLSVRLKHRARRPFEAKFRIQQTWDGRQRDQCQELAGSGSCPYILLEQFGKPGSTGSLVDVDVRRRERDVVGASAITRPTHRKRASGQTPGGRGYRSALALTHIVRHYVIPNARSLSAPHATV